MLKKISSTIVLLFITVLILQIDSTIQTALIQTGILFLYSLLWFNTVTIPLKENKTLVLIYVLLYALIFVAILKLTGNI